MTDMQNLNGILVINKEPGYTSHDVVNCVRKIVGMKRVGHTGTLDPDATGVLPVCLGTATRVSDMLMQTDKEYVAGFLLGVETDTQDSSGTVLCRRDVSVSEAQLRQVVSQFVGEISQIPPMYSAVKIGGKKLYELARKGVEVERVPRQVTVHALNVQAFEKNQGTLLIRCSKGTYVRTLIHDIGQALGCGACMTRLVRTKSSIFSLEDAVSLKQLETLVKAGALLDALIETDRVFLDLPAWTADEAAARRFLNGARTTVPLAAGRYRIYGEGDVFLGIGLVSSQNGRNVLATEKTFYRTS